MTTLSKPYILSSDLATKAKAAGLDFRKILAEGVHSLSEDECRAIRVAEKDFIYSSVRIEEEDWQMMRAKKLPFFATFEYLVNKSLLPN